MARTKDTSLAERDRRICLLRRNGFTFSEIAQMESLSRVRVSQIVHEANGELPEDETRAEIASLLEFAERKVVELINDPGYMLGPNGRLATDEDGNPVLNKQLVNESLRTLVGIADRRSKLYAADKPQKRTIALELAQQQAEASMAAITAQREAERRELEALRKQAGQPPVIPGQVERPEIEG